MKKLMSILFAVVTFIAYSPFAYAADSSVSVTISARTKALPGESCTLDIVIDAKNISSYKFSLICDNATITNKTKYDYEFSLVNNTDHTDSGVIALVINSHAKAGDTISVTAKGVYSIASDSDDGINNDINYTFTMTVAGTETPTSAPTSPPTAAPTTAPTVAPTPAPSTSHTASATAASPRVGEQGLRTSSPSSAPTRSDAMPSTASDASPILSASGASDIAESLSAHLDAMPDGASLTIGTTELTDSAMLPASVLQALLAKQGTLIINMGQYAWTVDAKALGASPNAADLRVSFDTDASISEMAKNQDLYQLHLLQPGDFPGYLDLRFAATGSQPGDTLSLYFCHIPSGIPEFIQSAIVDNDGCVTFSVLEGGYYYVTDQATQNNPATGDTGALSAPLQNSLGFIVIISVVCSVGAGALVLWYFMRRGTIRFVRK